MDKCDFMLGLIADMELATGPRLTVKADAFSFRPPTEDDFDVRLLSIVTHQASVPCGSRFFGLSNEGSDYDILVHNSELEKLKLPELINKYLKNYCEEEADVLKRRRFGSAQSLKIVNENTGACTNLILCDNIARVRWGRAVKLMREMCKSEALRKFLKTKENRVAVFEALRKGEFGPKD